MSTSSDALQQLSHKQRQRLSFIDFSLYFLGEVRRADIMARFDVAPAVQTRDLALYRQLAAANLELDLSTKAYRMLPTFQPLFAHPLEPVMAALIQGRPYSIEIADRPVLPADYPAVLNRPAMPVLAAVSRAMHQQRLLQVRYHSASSGEQMRVIAPHALVDNGPRWHVRAFDRLRGRFIDLVLTRILAADALDDTPQPHEHASHDAQWQRIVSLQLVPHPRLPDPAIAALDYAMTDGMLTINARAANVGYLLRRWYVDCSADAAIRDPACRLWLKNQADLQDIASAVLAPGWPTLAASQTE